MGFWSRLLGIDSYDAAQRVLPAPYEPYVSTAGIPVADPGTPLDYWIRGTADAEHVWRTQPNVRKVIGFAARNVASTPLHVHERISDTDRRRITDHPLARAVTSPRPRIGAYRFWEAVISDGLLYDRWAVLKRFQADGSVTLSRVPSWRLRFVSDAFGEVAQAWYWTGEKWIELNLDELIFDHGYAPQTAGMSPVETLRDLLDETAEAIEYRRQVWGNGARMPQYVTRPKDAPQWSDESRSRFIASMRNYTRDGGKGGGVPLLEDGMDLKDGNRMPSSDMLDLDGRQLTAVEVASAWHIAPELIGARQGNYSNVDAYRQMLYRESLGPYITGWEQAINVGLTPDLAEGRPLYVEANLDAKLRGSFQEQASILSTATGRPWMVTDEARARMNLPALGGDADQLVTPLNVLIGGQASPTDSGTQNEKPKSGRKVLHPLGKAASDRHRAKIAEVLSAFFARQGKSVLSAIGSGDDWWDTKRWDAELSDDLMRVSHTLAATLGKFEADRLGYPDGYDPAQTTNFLKAVADRYAVTVNETTKAQLEDAIAAEDGDPAHVFEVAKDSRADGVGSQVATFVAGFAAIEAARQIARSEGVEPIKTWVTGPNPRPEHAAMDGETVPIDQPFSDGNDWPGGAPGCNCGVSISI